MVGLVVAALVYMLGFFATVVAGCEDRLPLARVFLRALVWPWVLVSAFLEPT